MIEIVLSQTKVSGKIIDKNRQAIPFCTIQFSGTTTGVLSNENGDFYLESDKDFTEITVSAQGFTEKKIPLKQGANLNLAIYLNTSENLKEVKVFAGKTSKKNNPALRILRKIWERKRKNGLHLFAQYKLQKYEKVSFEMNSIDSTFMKNRAFRGMEFIFKNIDTSRVTGKSYLPFFITESIYDVYGDNKLKKKKEILVANRNSGLKNNDAVNAFVKDLYTDYNIYDNYIKFFDKNFTSPISTTGIDTYSYILKDSAFVDKKWCYNIVFYPRRKGELTFKGDFWVNDSTYAIKKINMSVSKSANINWVKDIYLEQEFDVKNDSVFLLSKDYMMTDFSFSKSEKSKGIYGKRTTIYDKHSFNEPKPASFYKDDVVFIGNEVYNKPDSYWEENRSENLNKDEKGIYKMLDTLQNVKQFRRAYQLIAMLTTGYYQIGHFDYGPVFSTIGFNEVEGTRLRLGGRTFFGQNDIWRLEGYSAYGLKDEAFKFGISGKWMLEKRNRIILNIGTREDVEQIGARLTTSNDVLGRSFASSSLFSTSTNGKLSKLKFHSIDLQLEPIKNLTLQGGLSWRKVQSASDSFSMNYLDENGQIKSDVTQTETNLSIEYTPNRETTGYGVDRNIVANPFSVYRIQFQHGFQGKDYSDFRYNKLQLYIRQHISMGFFGRSECIAESGKIFGKVPLALLSVIPGNQSYFTISNTFSNLNFYEFVSDQYASFQWNHNFNGMILSRVPYLRNLNLREFISIRGVIGSISDENKAINASNILYQAPEKGYWEYGFGIGNILKVFRLDFMWRGNYKELPGAEKFTIKGSFGFNF